MGNVLERGGGTGGGMLDLLHLPFGKLELTPSNCRHQGRGREDRWTEHQDRRENQKLIVGEGKTAR